MAEFEMDDDLFGNPEPATKRQHKEEPVDEPIQLPPAPVSRPKVATATRVASRPTVPRAGPYAASPAAPGGTTTEIPVSTNVPGNANPLVQRVVKVANQQAPKASPGPSPLGTAPPVKASRANSTVEALKSISQNPQVGTKRKAPDSNGHADHSMPPLVAVKSEPAAKRQRTEEPVEDDIEEFADEEHEPPTFALKTTTTTSSVSTSTSTPHSDKKTAPPDQAILTLDGMKSIMKMVSEKIETANTQVIESIKTEYNNRLSELRVEIDANKKSFIDLVEGAEKRVKALEDELAKQAKINQANANVADNFRRALLRNYPNADFISTASSDELRESLSKTNPLYYTLHSVAVSSFSSADGKTELENLVKNVLIETGVLLQEEQQEDQPDQ